MIKDVVLKEYFREVYMKRFCKGFEHSEEENKG